MGWSLPSKPDQHSEWRCSLYAQWAANTYSVSFNGNASTAGLMENQIVRTMKPET